MRPHDVLGVVIAALSAAQALALDPKFQCVTESLPFEPINRDSDGNLVNSDDRSTTEEPWYGEFADMPIYDVPLSKASADEAPKTGDTTIEGLWDPFASDPPTYYKPRQTVTRAIGKALDALTALKAMIRANNTEVGAVFNAVQDIEPVLFYFSEIESRRVRDTAREEISAMVAKVETQIAELERRRAWL